MLPYFKKYTIYVCVIAVALPVIVSTIWPLLTGQMMAASLGGLATMFVLFFGGLLISFNFFNKKAWAIVDANVAKYNEDCDPQYLVKAGQSFAQQVRFPCDQNAAWFMGYYAQALLDEGHIDEAKNILENLKLSADTAKSIQVKVDIYVAMLPLVKKIEGIDAALQLALQAKELLPQLDATKNAQIGEFINGQTVILEAEQSGNQEDIAKVNEAIAQNARIPMRLRVESAWDAASAFYKLGNKDSEKKMMQFVAQHGNKLAMASKAKQRLASL